MEESVSVIVPFYNEETNVQAMVNAVYSALKDYELPWELIVVDDGSTDRTVEVMRECEVECGSSLCVVELQRNFGQTAAMQAGIDKARGSLLVTLDGDLQNDPTDIPAMVKDLQDRKLDLLQGWRKKRKDKLIMRKIPSKIANKLIGKVTGVYLHDYGCSLKVYRASIMKNVRLYGEMHRFIPAWVAMSVPPSRIGERVVNHQERVSGESKYGLSRTFRVILDLLFVWFFMRFRTRPGHFFGSIGLGLGAIGALSLTWLAIQKFIMGADIGSRPLLLISILFIVASVQFLTTGILAELLSRIYFESAKRKSYVIRGENSEEEPDKLSGRAWFEGK